MEHIIAAIIVGLAIAYIVKTFYNNFSGKSKCSSGCTCCSSAIECNDSAADPPEE